MFYLFDTNILYFITQTKQFAKNFQFIFTTIQPQLLNSRMHNQQHQENA